jgi:hypothetical protein
MHRADIPTKLNSGETQGLTHLAMAVGSREAVNQLTEKPAMDTDFLDGLLDDPLGGK